MARKKVIEPSDGLTPDQARVIEVAIRCFEQYGPQRTTMADIAEAAGVSRKTIYRWFEERATLIEHVLVKMFDESSVDVFSFVTKFKDPREAIIEGAIFSIENSLENELFNQLVYKDNSHQTIQLLFRTNEHIYQSLLEFWGPIFQNGRQQGQIRKSLSDRRILDAFANVPLDPVLAPRI